MISHDDCLKLGELSLTPSPGMADDTCVFGEFQHEYENANLETHYLKNVIFISAY